MCEREAPGMQRLTPEQLLHRLHPRIALPRPAVERVAEQRMSQLGEVNADLMSAAGLEADLEQRGAMQACAHAPGGHRWLASLRSAREALSVARVAAVKRLELSGVRRLTVHEREVRLLHASCLERALERLERGVVLGDDEAARGLLVQAVHDARPEHAPHAGQAGDVVEQRVHERAARMSGGGVDDEPRGLVE